MNEGQREAYCAAKNGHSFVLAGSAGTGKSWVTKEIIKSLQDDGKNILVTCSTGIACLQLSKATTVHHAFGLWDGRYTESQLKHLFDSDDSYAARKKIIKEANTLLIDEISMISLHVLTIVEALCRHIRQSHAVMGGLQVILVGDFYQLSPVPNALYDDNGQRCFHHPLFTKIAPHTIVLGEVMRQEETLLIDAVRELAWGVVTESTIAFIKSLERPLRNDFSPTHLCALNLEVDVYNLCKLEDMKGVPHKYLSEDLGDPKLLKRMLVPKELTLKVGAPVMLLRNIPNSKMCNGLRGVVQSLSKESVKVFFQRIGTTHSFTRETFTQYDPKRGVQAASRIQFPLKLAFALTIHKSQGMTLDSVVVDCAGIFTAGQLAVAIGRARNTSGLRVTNFNPAIHIIKAHDDVCSFYSVLSPELKGDMACCQNRAWIDTSLNAPICDIEFPDDDEADEATDQELLSIMEEYFTPTDNAEHDDSEILHDLQEEFETDMEFEDSDQRQEVHITLDTDAPFILQPNQIIKQIAIHNPITPEQIAINHEIGDLEKDPGMQGLVNQIVVNLESMWKATGIKQGCGHAALRNFYAAFDNFIAFKYSDIAGGALSSKFSSIVLNKFLLKARELYVCRKQLMSAKEFPTPDSVPSLSLEDLTEAGKGKIRYLAGRCLSKLRQELYVSLNDKLKGSNKLASLGTQTSRAKAVAETQRALAHIGHMKSHASAIRKGEHAASLDETERRQNIGRGLTHVSDRTYLFYINLESKRQMQHTLHNAKRFKGDVLFQSRENILADHSLRKHFDDIFEDFQQQQNNIKDEIYTKLVDRYLVVSNNEFRKRLHIKFGKQKTFRHRTKIFIAKTKKEPAIKQKKTEKKQAQSTVDPLASLSDAEDYKPKMVAQRRGRGRGKECGEVKGKRSCGEVKRRRAEAQAVSREAKEKGSNVDTRGDGSIDRSSGEGEGEGSSGDSKGKGRNAETKGCGSSEGVKQGENSRASDEKVGCGASIGKGRGKGKGRGRGRGRGRGHQKIELDNVCPSCHLEHSDDFEWICCDLCNKWYDRDCANLSDDEAWAEFQTDGSHWFCCKCV